MYNFLILKEILKYFVASGLAETSNETQRKDSTLPQLLPNSLWNQNVKRLAWSARLVEQVGLGHGLQIGQRSGDDLTVAQGQVNHLIAAVHVVHGNC